MGRTGTETERLQGIMARLRAEGGCPWDRAQNLASLRPYLVEETYEVLDEMDRVAAGGPWRALCEELGDLLFQIVFHAQLASEIGEFELADVAASISDKIVSRHPHVFADVKVSGAEQVLQNWARLKAEERLKRTGSVGSVLDGVPSAAPALLRAERLTEKASRIGFDWPDIAGVREKLQEELGELDRAMASKDRDAVEHELGDVLFSLANLARFLATPAEDALRAANNRFTTRFHAVEHGLRVDGVAFGEATLAQMDALWEEAKAEEAMLPRPVHAPRAQLQQVQLFVADLAADFWQKVGPLLGWAVSADAAGVRCDTGVVVLRLAQGVKGSRVELDAQLVAEIPALAGAVREAGGLLLQEDAGLCVFSDPGHSVVVRSRTSTHETGALPTGAV
jgi:nucleoside triphosphate diphosphatase